MEKNFKEEEKMVVRRTLFVFSVLVCVVCTVSFAQNATVEKAATAVTKDAVQSLAQAEAPKTDPQKQQAVSATTAALQEQAQQLPKVEATQASQPAKEEVVKGIVKEIAEDGTSITIDNTKVLTTKEFLEDSYLEVGDNVEVAADRTESGLKAKSYNYIFEDEAVMPATEGIAPSSIEAPAKAQ